MKIVIMSDTHDLLRTEVYEALADADAIIHAGDLQSRKIVDELETYAPLYVVRGNNDFGWAYDIPNTLRFELGGIRFFAVHARHDIPKDLEDVDVIVFGHSHKYLCEELDGVLMLNPGSCGRRRMHLDITFAVMTVEDGRYTVEKIVIPQ